MIDFQSLVDQGKDVSHFPSHERVAYKMGLDLVKQKNNFIGFSEGPKSPSDVLHLLLDTFRT